MVTFLPFRSFKKCAKALDNKRLGKQRVEAQQILNTLQRIRMNRKVPAWGHHPAVLMWQGYEMALRFYLSCMIKEWKRRGFENNMPDPMHKLTFDLRWKPPWLNKTLCMSHRSRLLQKDRKYYKKFGWHVPKVPYYWPVRWDKKAEAPKNVPIAEYKQEAKNA